MAHIIATLFPVFAVLALGYGLARTAFLSRTFLNELNRLVYFVALPALMIHSVAGAEELPRQFLPALAVFISATVGTMALAFLNARVSLPDSLPAMYSLSGHISPSKQMNIRAQNKCREWSGG